MSNVYTKINKKSKKGKITKLMQKYMDHHNNLLWKANRKRTIKLIDWNNNLYSPELNQQNINNVPSKVVLSTKKTMRNGIVKKEFYEHQLTQKDKKLVASKLVQEEESKNTYKSRKIEIKKRILDNILFSDLGGNTISLGDYYKGKLIPNKISNYKLKEIVKTLFDIEKPINIEFNPPNNNFNIDFKSEKKHTGQLFKLRNNKLKIVILLS